MNRTRVLEDQEIEWFKRDRELFGLKNTTRHTLRSVVNQIFGGCRDLFAIQKKPSNYVSEVAAHLREGLELGTLEIVEPANTSPQD
jgi:hypothetical protein